MAIVINSISLVPRLLSGLPPPANTPRIVLEPALTPDFPDDNSPNFVALPFD